MNPKLYRMFVIIFLLGGALESARGASELIFTMPVTGYQSTQDNEDPVQHSERPFATHEVRFFEDRFEVWTPGENPALVKVVFKPEVGSDPSLNDPTVSDFWEGVTSIHRGCRPKSIHLRPSGIQEPVTHHLDFIPAMGGGNELIRKSVTLPLEGAVSDLRPLMAPESIDKLWGSGSGRWREVSYSSMVIRYRPLKNGTVLLYEIFGGPTDGTTEMVTHLDLLEQRALTYFGRNRGDLRVLTRSDGGAFAIRTPNSLHYHLTDRDLRARPITCSHRPDRVVFGPRETLLTMTQNFSNKGTSAWQTNVCYEKLELVEGSPSIIPMQKMARSLQLGELEPANIPTSLEEFRISTEARLLELQSRLQAAQAAEEVQSLIVSTWKRHPTELRSRDKLRAQEWFASRLMGLLSPITHVKPPRALNMPTLAPAKQLTETSASSGEEVRSEFADSTSYCPIL